DHAALAALASDMARLLAQDDSAAVRLLPQIAPLLAAAGCPAHAQRLQRLLAKYDFDAAQATLAAAAAELNINL
ncbi:hypothetical protein, partial [Duganella alba]